MPRSTAECDRCGTIGDAILFIAITVNGETYPLCLGCIGELGVWWSNIERKEVTSDGKETAAQGQHEADQAEEGEAVRILNGGAPEVEAEVEVPQGELALEEREEEEG
jgi:hypothetical protein